MDNGRSYAWILQQARMAGTSRSCRQSLNKLASTDPLTTGLHQQPNFGTRVLDAVLPDRRITCGVANESLCGQCSPVRWRGMASMHLFCCPAIVEPLHLDPA
jgi:hypothetical protein